jgi:hypothetical protein
MQHPSLQNELCKLQMEELHLQSNLRDVQMKIKDKILAMQQKCNHNWEIEQECCMYGETFTLCSKCNANK